MYIDFIQNIQKIQASMASTVLRHCIIICISSKVTQRLDMIFIWFAVDKLQTNNKTCFHESLMKNCK